MSSVLVEPHRHSRMSSKEENEIRKIFYEHWEKMKSQMEAVTIGIETWRAERVQAINSYADKQVDILRRHYILQQSIFDKKREENLETGKAYHKSKQTDLFNDLYTACQSLEFQVAQLEYVINHSERPRVITADGQAGRTNQDTAKTQKSTSKDANVAERTGNNLARSFNQQQPKASFSDSNGLPVSSGNNPEARVSNNDDLIAKCSVCFMIFPMSMTRDDRYRHVNEH